MTFNVDAETLARLEAFPTLTEPEARDCTLVVVGEGAEQRTFFVPTVVYAAARVATWKATLESRPN